MLWSSWFSLGSFLLLLFLGEILPVCNPLKKKDDVTTIQTTPTRNNSWTLRDSAEPATRGLRNAAGLNGPLTATEANVLAALAPPLTDGLVSDHRVEQTDLHLVAPDHRVFPGNQPGVRGLLVGLVQRHVGLPHVRPEKGALEKRRREDERTLLPASRVCALAPPSAGGRKHFHIRLSVYFISRINVFGEGNL